MFTATQDRTYNLSSKSSSRQTSPSRGAVMAVVLTAAYCTVAVVLISVLLWMAATEVSRPDAAPGRIMFWVAAVALVLWAALPRPDRFDPPGSRVVSGDEPALFATIEDVARQTGQQVPAEVYLVNDVSATVTSRGGFAGFGTRRVLLLGLPLMEAVSVQELKALLAHEFGHSHDGTVRLGRWIHRVRTAVVTSMPPPQSAAASVFAWYGNLFLRATQDAARCQELVADAVAARLVGANALISALRTVHARAMAYRTYIQQELQPVVDRGCLPPEGVGFRRYLDAPGMAGYLDAVIQCEPAFGEPEPLDAHPPLKDRIAALEELATHAAGDTRRATALLTDVIVWEHSIFCAISSWSALQPLDWDQVADAVYVPLWRARVDSHGHLLRGQTIATLPTTSAEFAALGSKMSGRGKDAPTDRACIERAGHLILAAIVVRLAERGWSVTALPGEETILRGNGHELRPYSELRAVLDGRVTASRWRERCVELGIADVRLWGAAGGGHDGASGTMAGRRLPGQNHALPS